MKKTKRSHIIISLLLFFCPMLVFGQLYSKVDERFELTSIGCRLAGFEEYVCNNVPQYAEDIDKYFNKYNNHSLITFLKKIRDEHKVAYDAFPAAAFILEIEKGKISIISGIDLDKFIENDPRWTKETLLQYVRLLNKFYKDSKFRRFYNANSELYNSAEKELDQYITLIKPEWFEGLYGIPFGNAQVFVSLVNGPSNYSMSSYESDQYEYGILIGTPSVIQDGKPFFYPNIFFTIIHELCHAFTNPIIIPSLDKFMPAADIIFPYVKDQLRKVGYGDKESMIIECFNNLFQNMIIDIEMPEWTTAKVGQNQNYGFIWMMRLMLFMDNFRMNRDVYPYINDFMPQLVSFMYFIASDMEHIKFEYDNRQPYVTSCFPANNSIVNPDIKELRFTFSRDMSTMSQGMGLIKSPEIHILDLDDGEWIDNRTIVFTIKSVLKENTKYGFRLPYSAYMTLTNNFISNDFQLVFTTGERK